MCIYIHGEFFEGGVNFKVNSMWLFEIQSACSMYTCSYIAVARQLKGRGQLSKGGDSPPSPHIEDIVHT